MHGNRPVITCPVRFRENWLIADDAADFFFGEVHQDTWIITPRETVETMIKRVPVWRDRGADQNECYRRLVDVIGYPKKIAEYYLEKIFATD